MKFRKHNTYAAYADIYDEFKGDRSSAIQLVLDLIEKYKPDSHLILDLACGTGSIAQGLVNRFQVVGLDESKRMLQIAKHKIPGARFVRGDMVHFRLDTIFDVVYCLHNSVNHLLAFQDWENMFATVAHHLAPGGVFIFDINPPDKMDYLATLESAVKPVGDNYISTQIVKDRSPGHYIWNMNILLKDMKWGYVLHDESVKVSSYPSKEISKALSTSFEIVEHFVPVNPTFPDDVGREYYVCIKKSQVS